MALLGDCAMLLWYDILDEAQSTRTTHGIRASTSPSESRSRDS
jgi:hypothetical protein